MTIAEKLEFDEKLTLQRLEEENCFLTGNEIVNPIRDQWDGGEGVLYPILGKLRRQGRVVRKKEYDEKIKKRRYVWKKSDR